MLEDGVAGMRALQQAGGFTIVQDPSDAAYPDLPTHALASFTPDRVLPADSIGDVLVALTGSEVESHSAPASVRGEAALDQQQTIAAPGQLEELGPQTSLSCPDCGGPLWDLGDPKLRRYRCYVGHVASAQRVLNATTNTVEAAMWSAIRALHDRATTYDAIAEDVARTGNQQSRELFRAKAREARTQAELARKFMVDVTRE
jgi:two-component system chemotaxis response regulator CheB